MPHINIIISQIVIQNVQAQHPIENVKSTCNLHDFEFKRTNVFTLFQKDMCVLLFITLCYVAMYIVE